MKKQVLKQLIDILKEADMSHEEILAFEAGIINLPIENQVELYRYFYDDNTLIYPTFVHYMAKRRAKETGVGWEEAVQAEIKFLEHYIDKRRVGQEVKNN